MKKVAVPVVVLTSNITLLIESGARSCADTPASETDIPKASRIFMDRVGAALVGHLVAQAYFNISQYREVKSTIPLNGQGRASLATGRQTPTSPEQDHFFIKDLVPQL